MLKLKEVLGDCNHVLLNGSPDIDISNIEHDSRKINDGSMFIALRGFNVDGHNYIQQAIEKGANCIVVEKDIPIERDDVTIIKVDDTFEALAKISSLFYEEPSKKMNIIGVTGTNGKTSITYLVKSIFETDGKRTGLIGTMGSIVNDEQIENKNTTPESLIIQKHLKNMIQSKIQYCIMEVSSHALSLKRVDNVNFQAGIFTNLTEDHLDYHNTMENYYNSKLKLFNMTKKYNIINIDDKYGKRMIKELDNDVPILSYGIDENCEVYATDIVYHTKGVNFTLNTPKGIIPINLKLLGKFNVYNALAAICCGIIFDISLPIIKKGIESITGIKGRFETVPIGDRDYNVIIDYAHTPDGLEKVLSTIDQFAEGRKIVVFGAGGNRDEKKRPIMGETVAKHADLCIVTSDNPRFEDPKQIIKDVLVGVKKVQGNYIAITDRREAIKYVLENAQSKDTILLAGKGHETYTIIKDKVVPFDEKQIVLDILKDMD